MLHALLGLSTREEAVSHPKAGTSQEGFAVQQVVQLLGALPEQCFHWSTHSGAELDLLVVAGNRRYGFEVKRAEAPRLTPSMRSAVEALGLDDSTSCAPGRNAMRWPRATPERFARRSSAT
jgi:predicted AAA+ superfamily ATPase